MKFTRKNKKIITAVICIIVILAMILPLLIVTFS